MNHSRAMSAIPALISLSLAIVSCSLDEAPESDRASVQNPLVYPSQTQGVRFDRSEIVHDHEGNMLVVRAVLRDAGTNLRVGIRASVDGGPWQDVDGSLEGPVGTDRSAWQIQHRPSGAWKNVEFAVFARDIDTQSARWDNNGNRNFGAGVEDVVHRVGDQFVEGELRIDLDVKNLAYDKVCGGVITTNGWVDQGLLEGHYVGPSSRPGFERWQVVASATEDRSVDLTGSFFQYAVNCAMNGEYHWDNNRQGNYLHQKAAPATRRWRAAFDGGQRAILASDGSTFVLSSDRWITGYSSSGQWLFASDMGDAVGEWFWSPTAGHLLVRAGSKWKALTLAGSSRWSIDGIGAVLTHRETGEYLVGAKGAAYLGVAVPSWAGPSEGCLVAPAPTQDVPYPAESYPVVTESGRLACQTGSSVAILSIHDPVAIQRLPLAGLPWAGDEGALVLISEDRSTLQGYDWSGAPLWARSHFSVAPDSRFGAGRECGNHALGSTAVYATQSEQFGSGEDRAYVGFDLATGSELFRHELGYDYTYNPCPRGDGAFWASNQPYKYGWAVNRILVDGTLARFAEGGYYGVFSHSADGAVGLRTWRYGVSQGFLTVRDAANREIFQKTLFDANALEHAVAATGDFVVVVQPGEVIQYRLDL
jgi:hypothetical protein